MAVAGPAGQGGGWHHRLDARHGGEPEGLPAAHRPTTRPGLPHRPRGSRLLPGLRHGPGRRLESLQGKRTGENALLRELDGAFDPQDVVLGDRCFGGYFDLALWQARGVDAVVRLHQQRRADFRTGRRLGRKDHVVAWAKPPRPAWLDEATYQSLPATLEVREVEVRVSQRGFRSRKLVVVTTLLDEDTYPACELATLYRARWHAELDLRSLKVTLGMDVLRCQSPEMVRKEFWAHLLAYNLIRTVLARAALDLGALPRELSFKGALQAIQAFAERLVGAEEEAVQELQEWLVIVVASHQVGDRPDRVEPRKRKRRPKHYPNLTQPRAQARKATLAGR